MKFEIELRQDAIQELVIDAIVKDFVSREIGDYWDEYRKLRGDVTREIKHGIRKMVREVFSENQEAFIQATKEATIEFLKGSTNYPSSIIRKAIAEAQKALEESEQ